MFESFEISPVCHSPGEQDVLAHGTMTDAQQDAMSRGNGACVTYGLYGRDEEGFATHVVDLNTKDLMVKMVDGLFGVDISNWNGQERLVFTKWAVEQNDRIIVQSLVRALHPGAIGLIGKHHGEDRLQAASMAVMAAKAMLAPQLRCEQSMVADAAKIDAPSVVTLDLSGGAIHGVNATRQARVIIIDKDVEGADGENILKIDGQDCYVRDEVVGLDPACNQEALSLLEKVTQAKSEADAS